MFSLVITVVSVALVAALAIATIYYGGPSLNKSQARAQAAAIVNQAAQVDSAIVLFHMNNGRWPANEAELIDGNYLKSIPQATMAIAANAPSIVDLVIPSAYAAETLPWAQVAPSTPQFWVLRAISKPVCQGINLAARGDNGIYNAAIPGVKLQCFGQNQNYTVLLHYDAIDSAESVETAVPANGGIPALVVDSSGGGWAVAPDTTVVAPPSGSTGSGSGDGGGTVTPPVVTQPPVVTGLSPSSGPSAGGTAITLNGSNFQLGAQVYVDGTPVSTTVTSDTQLSFAAPAHSAGTASITVVSGSNTTSALNFTYVAAPSIGSISPTYGPMAGGTLVTIYGQNFASDAQVTIGGTPVTTTRVNSAQLTFTTPGATAGSVDIIVKSGSQSSTAASFVYTAPVGGKVTTLGLANLPQNLGNVTADDNGVYVVSGKNFYYITYAGVTTVLKNGGWGAPCTDSNMQPAAWTQQPNGDFAMIGNCSSPASTSYALRISATGQMLGSVRSETGLLVALTAGPDNSYYYNQRDGSPGNRWIRRIAADGSYLAGPATGQSTLGMAVDPTAPYIYFVTQSTPTNMVLNRCRTSDMSGCTQVSVGLLDYPSGTVGDTISAHPFLAFDGAGQLYAASPNAIYKMDKNTGAAAVYAGQPGTAGYVDGTGTAARLSIKSIGRGLNGKIYIHDNGVSGSRNAIRRLD